MYCLFIHTFFFSSHEFYFLASKSSIWFLFKSAWSFQIVSQCLLICDSILYFFFSMPSPYLTTAMCVVPGNFHICLLFLFFLVVPLLPFIPTDLWLCAQCLTLTAIPTVLILEAFSSNLPLLLGVLGMPSALAQILLDGGTPNLLFPSYSEPGHSKGKSIPYFCQSNNPKCSLPRI